jgi:hypothetical protein
MYNIEYNRQLLRHKSYLLMNCYFELVSAEPLVAAASTAGGPSAPLETASSKLAARCEVLRLWSTITIFSLLPAMAIPVVSSCVVAAVMSAAAAGSGCAAAAAVVALIAVHVTAARIIPAEILLPFWGVSGSGSGSGSELLDGSLHKTRISKKR